MTLTSEENDKRLKNLGVSLDKWETRESLYGILIGIIEHVTLELHEVWRSWEDALRELEWFSDGLDLNGNCIMICREMIEKQENLSFPFFDDCVGAILYRLRKERERNTDLLRRIEFLEGSLHGTD